MSVSNADKFVDGKITGFAVNRELSGDIIVTLTIMVGRVTFRKWKGSWDDFEDIEKAFSLGEKSRGDLLTSLLGHKVCFGRSDEGRYAISPQDSAADLWAIGIKTD